jgi:hypothetical protein
MTYIDIFKDDVQNLSHIYVGLAAPNLAEVEVAKRNQDSEKGTVMTENTPSRECPVLC